MQIDFLTLGPIDRFARMNAIRSSPDLYELKIGIGLLKSKPQSRSKDNP
jgi:hypothetical protein